MSVSFPSSLPGRVTSFFTPARPGVLSLGAHVIVYVLIGILAGVDYVLLSQSLLLLNRSNSEGGSIAGEMNFVAFAFAIMMVLLSHVAGTLEKRVQLKVAHGRVRRAVYGLVAVWLGVVIFVTLLRIVAGADESPSGTGLISSLATDGADTAISESAGFDPSSPNTMMAILTAFFLATTGSISAILAWYTHRPVLAAIVTAERRSEKFRTERDAASEEIILADGTLENAPALDSLDSERHKQAKGRVSAQAGHLRADIATIIVQSQGDPAATSQMIRALSDHRKAVHTTDPKD